MILGNFYFGGARKSHFPRFLGKSFINQNVEKRFAHSQSLGPISPISYLLIHLVHLALCVGVPGENILLASDARYNNNNNYGIYIALFHMLNALYNTLQQVCRDSWE